VLLQPRTPPARASARVSVPVGIVVGSLALAALSLLVPSAPTYDPWSWIIWGREVWEGDLDTVDGPSWKPLPVILTTLTAPLGDASAQVWVVAARAGALAAVALAYLLGARLGGRAAGIAAAGGLGLMPWWLRHNALANSEGLMVACVFAAVLTHLSGRRGWAFAFGIGAGLLRPEAWPFLGLYALWLLYEDRARLRWLAAGLASLPVLWLGPELWGSGNAFRASDRAQEPNPDSPAFADQPWLEVVKDAIVMVPTAAVAGAAVAVVVIALRRTPDRAAQATGLVLGVLAVAWTAEVAVMTERGFSGNQRYLIVPVALVIVLGAAGVVWAVRAVWRAAPGFAVGVALAAAFALPDAHALPEVYRGNEYQANLVRDLERLVEDAGGAERLKRCGHAFTGAFLVPQVAWRLHVHIQDVDLSPEPPATVFHVKTTEADRWYAPGLRAGAPHVVARRGAWILSTECARR
jgi:hypothetical protein